MVIEFKVDSPVAGDGRWENQLNEGFTEILIYATHYMYIYIYNIYIIYIYNIYIYIYLYIHMYIPFRILIIFDMISNDTTQL